MKAIVVDIKEGKAALLDKEGIVRVIPDRGYQIGQQLEADSLLVKEKDRKVYSFPLRNDGRTVVPDRQKKRGAAAFVQRHLVPVAASLVVLLGAGSGVTAYALPCSTVTVDINPSLKYTLNVFDLVIGTEGYNDDGEKVADEIRSRVRGKTIGEAIGITLDQLSEDSFIEDEEMPAVITVNSAFSREDRLSEKISEEVDDWNEGRKEEDGDRSVEPSIVKVSKEQKKQADDKKESPGRELLENILEERQESGQQTATEKIPEAGGPAAGSDKTAEQSKAQHDSAASGNETTQEQGAGTAPADPDMTGSQSPAQNEDQIRLPEEEQPRSQAQSVTKDDEDKSLETTQSQGQPQNQSLSQPLSADQPEVQGQQQLQTQSQTSDQASMPEQGRSGNDAQSADQADQVQPQSRNESQGGPSQPAGGGKP